VLTSDGEREERRRTILRRVGEAATKRKTFPARERNSVSTKRLANDLVNKLYQKGGKKQLLAGRCRREARKKSKIERVAV
jgi:hypothetical protein